MLFLRQKISGEGVKIHQICGREKLVWGGQELEAILSEAFSNSMGQKKLVEREYPIFGHVLRKSDGVEIPFTEPFIGGNLASKG